MNKPRTRPRRDFPRLVATALLLGLLAAGVTTASPATGFSPAEADRELFRQAAANGRQAAEAWSRCQRYLTAWLARADPATGLIPRNLTPEGAFWNGRDAGADNYPFMVLTAWFTDRALLEGRLLEMLKTEQRLTARVDRCFLDHAA